MTKLGTTSLVKLKYVRSWISSPLFTFIAATATAVVPPDVAVREFEVHPGLDISLFAAEPDIVDPVAMAFDEDGRIYVVEMRDYPLGIGPEQKPGGTVRLLEDRDGDGKIDRSTLFAD